MKKMIVVVTACALLCAASADAKSLNMGLYTNQELAERDQCWAELDKAAQSVRDAATEDKNGKPITPKILLKDRYRPKHEKCEKWENIVRQKEPNPPSN